MKAEPNKNGSITLIPENNAESFVLAQFNQGVSEYRTWISGDKATSGYFPKMTIYPGGITFEEFKKRNED